MTLVQVLPWLAGIGFLGFIVFYTTFGERRRKNAWLFPAGLSLAFLIWSLIAIGLEGPFGFWTEHTRNLWANQIWFDLLLAVGVGLTFLVPQAKALGMRVWPWLVLVLCTGSIGLLAMTARVVFLKERGAEAGPAGQPSAQAT